jgi:hypothetical protein
MRYSKLALALSGVAAVLLNTASAAHNILDFGGVPSALEIDTPTSFKNADAFMKAIQAANSSETDRVVHIPELPDGQRMYMMPLLIENISNITFVVDGYVTCSSDHINWPNHTDWQEEKQRVYMDS